MSVAIRKALRSTAAPRALLPLRRDRPTLSARTPVRHVTLPFHETAHIDLIAGETLDALVSRTGWAERVKVGRSKRWAFRLPTICVVNGKPILQREWRRLRLRAEDIVEFWSKPLGGREGGGKNVLGLVAIIALAAFAPWAGGALAGAMGLGAVGASIFTGLITLGGSLLIAALTRPKPGGQSAEAATEQIYSVAASGNSARLLQPITAQYGRVKSFPDFAIAPWSEFSGNDQYLNVLLSVGLGKHEYENLFLDDTILWDADTGISDTFTDVQVAFYEPDEQVALFPVNVTQADEVSGQVLTTDWAGGFVANAAGSQAKALAIDLAFPAGCFTIDSKGNIGGSSATIVVEARKVDGAGAPISSFVQLHSATHSYATRNPIRLTVKVDVDSARYEVRVKRTDAPLTDNGANEVEWAGLRAFIDGPASFPVSTVAIRIKANAQLTERTARKFGVLATRVLPVWDTDTQTWIEQATRSPAWAFFDAATDSTYGAGRPPSKVDFQSVYDLAAAATARGDTFDYRFTSAVAAPDAFDTILKGSRVRHRWSGDVLTIVRDEWSDTPRMLLTDREVARGSLSLEYALNTDDSADAVIVEYLDEDTWGPAEVQYPPNSESFTAVSSSRIRLDGVVNRDHAYREAAFYYLQAQYRRIQVNLDTEHDGRMLGFGSRVRVQSELPQSWGYTGTVVSRASNTLTVSPAPTWGSGSHYIAIRDKTGRQFGPVLCTQGVSAAAIILDALDLAAVESAQSTTLTAALARRDGAEDPSFDFGAGDSRARSCIVISGRPNGDRVSLKLVVDNEAVHETELGDVPIAPAVPALRDPAAPVVTNLLANFRQGVAEPILDASWQASAGATYYVAEVSYDVGESWIPVYEGRSPRLSAVVDYAALRLRVQGVGARHGAWYQVDVDAPVIRLAGGIVDQTSLNAALDARIRQVEATLGDILTIREDIDQLSGAANEQFTSIAERIGRILIGVGARYDENKAGAQIALTAATTANSALAAIFGEAFAVSEGGQADSLLRIIAASSEDEGVLALIELAVQAGYGGEIATAAMQFAAVYSSTEGLQSRAQIRADQFDIIVNGVTLPARLFTVQNEPENVPIVNGYVQVDLSTRKTQFKTLLTRDVTLRAPQGAQAGDDWKHTFVQDSVGGYTVSVDPSIYYSGDPDILTNAGYSTLVDCHLDEVAPPKGIVTVRGGGNPALGSATSFAFNPPYNNGVTNITYWDVAVDGPLIVQGPYTGTITFLHSVNGFVGSIEVWGGGAPGRIYAAQVGGNTTTGFGMTAAGGAAVASGGSPQIGSGGGGASGGNTINTTGNTGGTGNVPNGGLGAGAPNGGGNVAQGTGGSFPGGGGGGVNSGSGASGTGGGGSGGYAKSIFTAGMLVGAFPVVVATSRLSLSGPNGEQGGYGMSGAIRFSA